MGLTGSKTGMEDLHTTLAQFCFYFLKGFDKENGSKTGMEEQKKRGWGASNWYGGSPYHFGAILN